MDDKRRDVEIGRWAISGAIAHGPSLRLLIVLWTRWGRLWDDDGAVASTVVWPGRALLASTLGCSERTITRCLRVLQDAGAIERGRDPEHGHLGWTLLPCPHDGPVTIDLRTTRDAGGTRMPVHGLRRSEKIDGTHAVPPMGHTPSPKRDTRRVGPEKPSGTHAVPQMGHTPSQERDTCRVTELTTNQPTNQPCPPEHAPPKPRGTHAEPTWRLTPPDETHQDRGPDPAAICELIRNALRWTTGSATARGPRPESRSTRQHIRAVWEREHATLEDWRRVVSAQAWDLRGKRPDLIRYLSLATLHRPGNWDRCHTRGQALSDDAVCPWERELEDIVAPPDEDCVPW